MRAKASCKAQLLKEPRVVCGLGGAGSQGVTEVEQAVFTSLMQIQIWYQCQASCPSARGTGHPGANHLLPGACRPLRIFKKVFTIS